MLVIIIHFITYSNLAWKVLFTHDVGFVENFQMTSV